MPKQLFIDEWERIHPLNKDLRTLLQQRIILINLKKGEKLYHQDERQYRIYFVIKGFLVAHRLENNRNIVCWFVREKGFILDTNSFMHQKSAQNTVIATEDSVVACLNYIDLRIIHHDFPETNLINERLLNGYLEFQHTRSYLLTIDNSTERYHQFCKEFPWTLARMKRGDIASFLAMSAETLSRIR